MPFWVLIVIFVASIVLGELLRQKPQDSARAANLKDFSLPTAEESRPIPVIWGTVEIDAPNVTWYGDLETVKLTKKVKSGLFSSTRLSLAFRYSIGMQFALCHGPIDALLKVRTKNKDAFTGNVVGTAADGEEFTVDARTIYGGDADFQLEAGGYGGVYAKCVLYNGSQIQNSNAYLSTVLDTQVPGARGIAHIVWKGPSSGEKVYNYDLGDPSIAFTREPFLSGYIGCRTDLTPISFVVKRIPNVLSGTANTFYIVNGGDANPADALVELLTNEEWGLGLATGLIDIPSFEYAQEILYNEGIGISGIWDSQKQVTEVISEILKLVDGVIYPDIQTGLITLKLARDDYDVNAIPVLTKDEIVEINSFSRSSIDETTNEIQLTYIDRFQNYKSRTTVVHDLANARKQNDVVSSSISYFGISNSTLAENIAQRDLRTSSIPLARVSFKMNRKGITFRPASVFKLVWPDYDVDGMIFRIVKITYGQYDNAIMEVEAVEDIFTLGIPIYGASDDSLWSNPNVPAAKPLQQFQIEAPYFFANISPRLKIFASKRDTGQLAFNSYVAVGSSSGTYLQVDSGDAYTPTGLLDGSYSAITADVDTTNTLVITPDTPDMMNRLQNFTSNLVEQGENMFLITDGTNQEIMAFETITYNSGTGKYTLSNIWRGLLDTVPRSWSAGARLWFFTYGEGFPSQNYKFGDTLYVQTKSTNASGESAATTAQSLVMNYRQVRPYPPGNFRINSSTSTVNITAGSNIQIDWSHRNKQSQAETVVKQFATVAESEGGVEYYIKFFNASNTLLRTVGPLTVTTTTYTYLNTDQVVDNGGSEPLVVTVQLYTKRAGIFSKFTQQRTLLRPGGSAPSPVAYSPGSETYDPPAEDNASSINGTPVSGSPTSSGQVLVYNGTAWVPQIITLAGDVTGAYNANTVVKLQNRALSATAPSDKQVIAWNNGGTTWEPKDIHAISAGSTIKTVSSTSATTHSTNNTYEDVTGMSISHTTVVASSLFCEYTCEVTGTSDNFEHIAFRFVLDGTTNSETWIKLKDIYPSNNERHLITIHTVFENVSIGAHTVKVQWQDNGSNLNVTLHKKRLTMIVGRYE